MHDLHWERVVQMQASLSDPGASSSARIQTSISAVQLERSMLVAKQHRLQAQVERLQDLDRLERQAASSIPSPVEAPVLAQLSPAAFLAQPAMIAARAQHLQVPSLSSTCTRLQKHQRHDALATLPLDDASMHVCMWILPIRSQHVYTDVKGIEPVFGFSFQINAQHGEAWVIGLEQYIAGHAIRQKSREPEGSIWIKSGGQTVKYWFACGAQAMKPSAAWEGHTPIPLDQLYSSILHGRMDVRLPLANAQAPERSMQLGRIVEMPVQQHLQLQVRVLI